MSKSPHPELIPAAVAIDTVHTMLEGVQLKTEALTGLGSAFECGLREKVTSEEDVHLVLSMVSQSLRTDVEVCLHTLDLADIEEH